MPVFQSLPLLKSGNVYSSVDVVKDKLFIVGGCNAEGKAQSTVQFTNLSGRREFIIINDMPRVKAGAAIVHLDNKLVTLGGIYNKQCPLDKVDVLDIEASTWMEFPSLSHAVQGPIVSVRENTIYCGGGLTSEMATLSDFHMMDLSVGSWQPLSSMKFSHFHAGTFQYQNNLYVIGGRQGKLSVKECECLDFRMGAWRTLPSIPDEFRNVFSSYVHSNDHIYVIGGLHEDPKNGFSNLFYRFDMVNEKWEKMPNILKPRADFGAICVDGKLLIAGGMGQLQGLPSSTEMYASETKRWSLGEDLPNMHASCSKCVHGRSLFLVSGMTPSGLSTHVTEISI